MKNWVPLSNARSRSGIPVSLINLCERCFGEKQLMAIRRLMDKDACVNSFFSLFHDIKQNAALFTRENFVCHDGLSYDETNNETCREKAEWKQRHIYYDILSGKHAEDRNRLDALSLNYIKTATDRFGTFEPLRTLSNKRIAHQTTQSQWNACPLFANMNDFLSELDKCYKNLIFMADRISFLIHTRIAPISIPNFDQFEGIDIPIITPNDHQRLHEIWGKRSDEIQKWITEAADQLKYTYKSEQ